MRHRETHLLAKLDHSADDRLHPERLAEQPYVLGILDKAGVTVPTMIT